MLSAQQYLWWSLFLAFAWQCLASPLQLRVTYASNIIGIHPHAPLSTVPISEHTTALAKRGANGIPMIACKQVWRHQQYAVIPSTLGAATLQAFWNTIQLRSLFDEFFNQPKALFTVTQGALQATFSCVGQGVPWDFVHDVAMNAADAAAMGLLETFDALYEQEGTGITAWVSLKVVETLGSKRKRPG